MSIKIGDVKKTKTEAEQTDARDTAVVVHESWLREIEEHLAEMVNEYDLPQYLTQLSDEEAIGTASWIGEWPTEAQWHVHIMEKLGSHNIGALLVNGNHEMWWISIPQLLEAIGWMLGCCSIGITCPNCTTRKLLSDRRVICGDCHDTAVYVCPKCLALTTMSGRQLEHHDGRLAFLSQRDEKDANMMW